MRDHVGTPAGDDEEAAAVATGAPIAWLNAGAIVPD
jgi:hypothetical protein